MKVKWHLGPPRVKSCLGFKRIVVELLLHLKYGRHVYNLLSPKIWIVTCLQSSLTSVLVYLDFTIVLDSPVGRIGCFLPLCEFGLVILDACTAKREDVNKV